MSDCAIAHRALPNRQSGKIGYLDWSAKRVFHLRQMQHRLLPIGADNGLLHGQTWLFPSNLARTRSCESLMRSRRCSGESTSINPPKDQKACPPRLCCGSWSTIMIFLASVYRVQPPQPNACETCTHKNDICFCRHEIIPRK